MARTRQADRDTKYWRGVFDTPEMTDEKGPWLYDAENVYCPNCNGLTGWYSRPGFPTVSTQLGAAGGRFGQQIYNHTATDGTEYRFLFCGGRVYRWNGNTTYTDVTPTGVTISTTARIFCASLNDQLIVTDGVNIPWIASSLSSSPIVGTYINYYTAGAKFHRDTTGVAADTVLAYYGICYLLAGTQYTKASGTAALVAGTIPSNTWGIYRYSINTAGTITGAAGVANFTTGYATEAVAIAAIPATPAGEWDLGYVTILTASGLAFVGGTDALAGGTSGNPATTTNYYAGRADPWTAFGRPRVYAGSMIFILASVANVPAALVTTPAFSSQRGTIAWCEANDPTTGYRQTDYANSWQLTQTDSDQLYALASSNQSLVVFRAESFLTLAGTPGPTFQTNHTKDTYEGTGTTAPAAVVEIGDTVWFLDKSGRPHRLRIGGALTPVWLALDQRARNAMSLVSQPTEISTYATGSAVPDLKLVAFAIWADAASQSARMLDVFDQETGNYLGQWRIGHATSGAYIDCVGVLRDANGAERFIVLGTAANTSYATANQGYAWIQAVNAGLATARDDNGTVLQGFVTTEFIGRDVAYEVAYDSVAIETLGDGGSVQTWSLQHMTSRTGFATAQTATSAVTATDDDGRFSPGHVEFGILAVGRGIRCKVGFHTRTLSQAGIGQVRVRFSPAGTAPNAP